MKSETQHIKPRFLSCDWGTSAFRLRAVGEDGSLSDVQLADSDGILPLHQSWIQSDKESSKETYLLTVLAKKVSQYSEKTGQSFQNVPLIVSGMASSSIGIRELPYSHLPLSLDQPQLNVEQIPGSDLLQNDLYIISGLSDEHDVMRGEETEAIGMFGAEFSGRDESVLDDSGNMTIIFPGTHSKHLFVSDRQLTGFKTWMTGELFELLATKSILAEGLGVSETPILTDAFRSGLQESEQNELTHSLFKLRADRLMKRITQREGLQTLSGLLIGSEIKSLAKNRKNHQAQQTQQVQQAQRSETTSNRVLLAAHEKLQPYYLEACHYFGLHPTVIDTRELVATAHQKLYHQFTRTESQS